MKLRWLIPLLFVLPAFATTGGTCPSASAYLTPTGTLTTLTALGITNGCYFVAANGADTNTGTDEAHPWLHAPQMTNCSNSCATVQNQSGGFPPGTGLILRGGDTWHFGNSGASPYAGSSTWHWNSGTAPRGTNANPIYVGVDTTWFSGGSWTRPILTEDNAPNSSQVLGSCTFPTGGNLIDWSGGAYFIVDNLELTGVCTTSANWNVVHMAYGSLFGWANLYNLYIHGWSHVGFPNPNNCTANSTCMSAFRGSVQSGHFPPADTLLFDVLDGADSDPVPMECLFTGGWHVAYSYFNNCSQFITTNQNSFHDNIIQNFVDNGHANVTESNGDAPGPSNVEATYNNIFRHLYVNTTVFSNVCFWPAPPVGATLYWFNNLIYDAGPCELYNMGQNGRDEGTISAFDNTFQLNHRTDGGTDNFSCSATGNHSTVTNGNNHYISTDVGSVAGMYAANCAGLFTDTTSLWMTNATATTDGYTNAQTFAFSPTSNGSPTVNTGTNRNGTFCSALTAASSTDPYLAGAASACQSDTSYSCTYSAGNHTMTCPARTSNSRPSGTGWDIGTYEFVGGGQATPPSCSPGTGNYAATQTVTCTNPNSGTTVMCYRTDGGTPASLGDGVNCAGGSTKYTGTLSFSGPSSTNLNIIAGTSILPDSIVVNYTYTFVVNTTVFSPPAGNYPVNQTVTMTSQSGASICFTNNGSDPIVTAGTCTNGNTIANGGSTLVTVNGATLKAIAFKTGLTNSAEATAVYNIGQITYVPSNCSTISRGVGTGNALTFTCTPNQTGDAITIFEACHALSGTPNSVAMSASGWSFTALSGLVGTGSGLVGQIFGAIAPNTSATTFTATWSGVTDCNSNAIEITGEFAGVSTLDGANSFNATGTSGGSSGGCNQAGANVTPPIANEAVWFSCLDNSTGATSPWNLGVSDLNGDMSEYQIFVGGAGTPRSAAFVSSGGYIVMGIALAPPVITPGGTIGTGIGYGAQVGIH